MDKPNRLAVAAELSVDVGGWVEQFESGFARIAGRFGRLEPPRQERAFLPRARWACNAITPVLPARNGMRKCLQQIGDRPNDCVRGFRGDEMSDTGKNPTRRARKGVLETVCSCVCRRD